MMNFMGVENNIIRTTVRETNRQTGGLTTPRVRRSMKMQLELPLEKGSGRILAKCLCLFKSGPQRASYDITAFTPRTPPAV